VSISQICKKAETQQKSKKINRVDLVIGLPSHTYTDATIQAAQTSILNLLLFFISPSI
jgi:hypothetical protein